MADPSSGKGIPILTPSEDHIFTLNEEALEKLLLRDDVKDLPAVVISVAGPFRKGKSFLLGFFLRYLYKKYIVNDIDGDWLGDPDESLKGFEWRGGSERHTTGLLLWSHPFIATLDNGTKMVIYLMDTQGTFDSTTTVKENATIFALSTMLSSVQIYNLSQNLEEDYLQHLQLFTNYGRLAQEDSSGKPFQRLQLLIRDWNYPYDNPYGSNGGQQILDKRLEINEDQHPELQALRESILSCFEELKCFLMPYPGRDVATNPNFKGSIIQIDDEFKKALKEFVPLLVAPENLIVKKIAGQMVKAKDLLHYFKAYMKIFNGSTLPDPKTILQVTAEANNLAAMAEAKKIYETLMTVGTQVYLIPVQLQEKHRHARETALNAFHTKKKMGGDKLSRSYANNLEMELDKKYKQYRALNDDKNVLRRLSTALMLVAAAVGAWMVSNFATLLHVDVLALLASLFAYACISMLMLWGYSRITGNYGDIAQVLDNRATWLVEMFGGLAARKVASVALSNTMDRKEE